MPATQIHLSNNRREGNCVQGQWSTWKFKEATDTKDIQNYVTHCWKDNDISKHNFNPIMKWKNIPDVVLSVHKSILQQLGLQS